MNEIKANLSSGTEYSRLCNWPLQAFREFRWYGNLQQLKI